MSKRFFSLLDGALVQTQADLEAFCRLGVDQAKAVVTGNIKYEAKPRAALPKEIAECKKILGLHEGVLTLVSISTHAGEERLLYEQIRPLFESFEQLKWIVIPRHTERADDIVKEFQALGEGVSRWSLLKEGDHLHRIILVDAVGVVPLFCQIATLCLMGGSFVPGIGGHNILEPAFLGSFPIFGPFMHKQVGLTKLVLEGHAGIQVAAEKLPPLLTDLLLHPSKRISFNESARHLTEQLSKVIDPTFQALNALEL